MKLVSLLFIFYSFGVQAKMVAMPGGVRPILSRVFPKTPEGDQCKKSMQSAITACVGAYNVKYSKDAATFQQGVASSNLNTGASSQAQIQMTASTQAQSATNELYASCRGNYNTYKQVCKEAKEILERRINDTNERNQEYGKHDMDGIKVLEKDVEAYFAEVAAQIGAETNTNTQAYTGSAQTYESANTGDTGSNSLNGTDVSQTQTQLQPQSQSQVQQQASGPQNIADCSAGGAWAGRCDADTLTKLYNKPSVLPTTPATAKPVLVDEQDAKLKSQNADLYKYLPSQQNQNSTSPNPLLPPTATVPNTKKRINLYTGFN